MEDDRRAILHGLTFEPGRSRWRLRITISRGAKQVGKRITLDLHGFSEAQAIEAKAVAVAALALVGLQPVKSRPRPRVGHCASF